MLILLLHLFFCCVIILNKHVKCFVTRRVIYIIMQSVHVCMCVYVCVCCEYPSMSSAEVLYPVNQYQYCVIKFLHTLLLDPLCVQ